MQGAAAAGGNLNLEILANRGLGELVEFSGGKGEMGHGW